MKLAILSDTHGLLRPEVMECLKDAGAILHGGGHQPAEYSGSAGGIRPPLCRPGQQ